MDIAAINGTPIAGHQGAGSITERTIRRLLTLQGSMRPDQIISLMEFAGTTNTIAMGDHADHIHVGFRSDGGASPSGALAPGSWRRLTERLASIETPRVGLSPSRYALTAVRRPDRGADPAE